MIFDARGGAIITREIIMEYYSPFTSFVAIQSIAAEVEYDPYSTFEEEYDPVDNWYIDMSQYKDTDNSVNVANILANLSAFFETEKIETPKPAGVATAQVEALLSEEERIAPKLEKFLRDTDRDVFNMSAMFLLRQTNIQINRNSLQIAHNILRNCQLQTLKLTSSEYEQIEPKVSLIRAVKSYDKNINNLSPKWALKLAKLGTRKFTDIASAMRSIDVVLNTRT